MPLSVIGAGVGRTGTLSLKLALEQLGFGPCYHMMEVFKDPTAPERWSRAADGEVDWEAMFEGYASSVDWPGARFWRELAELYPEAKVILTLRDAEAWFASTQATIFRPEMHARLEGTAFGAMLKRVVADSMEGHVNDRERALAFFHRHNAAVVEAIAPERLLVFDPAEGWGPLCAFLGVEVPDGPFPRTNSTEEFLARASGPPPS